MITHLRGLYRRALMRSAVMINHLSVIGAGRKLATLCSLIEGHHVSFFN